MTDRQEQGLTLTNIKGILPFATLLVALVLAWASWTSQVSLLTQRTEVIEARLGRMEDKLLEINDKLIALSTTIEGAKERGLLGSARVVSNTPSSKPVPSPTPSLNNQQPNQAVTFTQATNHPSEFLMPPTSTPSPQPSPIERLINQLPVVGNLL